MQITRYRITETDGGVRYTERIGEAIDAAKAGKKVEKRRVSISQRHGGSTPMTSWKVAKFEAAKVDRVIQYRVYLNPNEHFDTLDREKAVRHWQDGHLIHSRAVDHYPTSKGIHPVGYWQPHPLKDKQLNRYPELREEDLVKEDTNVSGLGSN